MMKVINCAFIPAQFDICISKTKNDTEADVSAVSSHGNAPTSDHTGWHISHRVGS